MQKLTLPIIGFWVVCREDEDLNEEFGATQFNQAKSYIHKQRKFWPEKQFEMIADVDI